MEFFYNIRTNWKARWLWPGGVVYRGALFVVQNPYHATIPLTLYPFFASTEYSTCTSTVVHFLMLALSSGIMSSGSLDKLGSSLVLRLVTFKL